MTTLSKLRHAFSAAAADLKDRPGREAMGMAVSATVCTGLLLAFGGAAMVPMTMIAPLVAGTAVGVWGTTAVRTAYKAYKAG